VISATVQKEHSAPKGEFAGLMKIFSPIERKEAPQELTLGQKIKQDYHELLHGGSIGAAIIGGLFGVNRRDTKVLEQDKQRLRA